MKTSIAIGMLLLVGAGIVWLVTPSPAKKAAAQTTYVQSAAPTASTNH